MKMIWLIATILLFVPLQQTFAASECSIAATAIEKASKLRGLSIRQTVPCKLQSREQVEQYLRETLHTKIPPQRLENEGWAFRLLGLVPLDFKYLEGLITLYTSQLGGYYDADKNYYAMANWMPDIMQLPIAVHELTHALQDQHYNLDKMVDSKTELSDSLMARSALIEGDATAVMLDFSRQLAGQKPISTESSVSTFMAQNLAGAMLTSSLQSAPQALQAILIFPYVSGLNFTHSLLKSGGYRAVDRAFTNLPVSTEQVLHPEKYAKGLVDFQEVENHLPPQSVSISSPAPIFSDRIGEFVISTWLSGWIPVPKASEAAAGWGGDRLALYSTAAGKHPVLVWALLWDTEKDAEEFYLAITEGFRKRFSKAPEEAEGGILFSETAVGNVRSKREGQKVIIVIG